MNTTSAMLVVSILQAESPAIPNGIAMLVEHLSNVYREN